MVSLNGWLKLDRSVLDNPVVTKSTNHLAVWIFLLCCATPKPYKVLFEGRETVISAGQLITSRQSIAERMKIKNTKGKVDGNVVQRVLKDFENAQQITQQGTNKNRLITICNWVKYQSTAQQGARQLHNERTTTAQQLHTYKEDKEDKENNKKNIYTVEIGDIVAYLNKKAGTNYAFNEKNTIELINARMKEGYTVADFEKMIDNKCADWLGTEWAKYLRPSTLFGEKFESYLKAPAPAAKKNKRGSMYSTEGASFDISKYENSSLFDD